MPGGYENVWPGWLLKQWVEEMNEANRIKVWQITECDWYAGPELEGCILSYLNDYDGPEEALDEFGEPFLLDDETMGRLLLHDPDGRAGPSTFAEALQQMIDDGVEFPISFANTEC